MADSGHNSYYNCNNISSATPDQLVRANLTNSNSNISTQFSNNQSGLSLEPLNTIQYNLHPNLRPKNYTLNDSNSSLQQMYQTTSQPLEYYSTEYLSLTNQNPLPITHNISPSSQNQIIGFQQNQPNSYQGVLFQSSPDASTKIHQSQVQRPTPPSSTGTHLRNSSTSYKRQSIDLDFVKPEKPRIATTYWEDEKTICYQVEAQGILVSRREDTGFVNGTKLLNVAGMTRGKRDGILKTEKTKSVVKVGAMNLKGVWIPFERASEIARNEGIDELLYPLFVKDLKAFFHEKGSMLKRDSYLKSLNSEDLTNIAFANLGLPGIEHEIVGINNSTYGEKAEESDFFNSKSPRSNSEKDAK